MVDGAQVLRYRKMAEGLMQHVHLEQDSAREV